MTTVAGLKRIKKVIKREIGPLFNWLSAFGFQPFELVSAVRDFPGVLKDFRTLRKQNRENRAGWDVRFTYPCFGGKKLASGTASGAYFHQDLLVARRIFDRKPVRHVDVASRIDGFVAHVAVFREIEVLDIRPQSNSVANVVFKQCDVMALPESFVNYCDSLSCLHALEHFGLGRYGDVPDIQGHNRGFRNLAKMLRPGGVFYLSMPIGRERIEFNAHRVLGIKTVLAWAEKDFGLIGFSYVDDRGDLHENVTLDAESTDRSFDLECGCGIFEFRKLQSNQ
jgi:SAM-dependent methyltransferase